MARGKRVQEPHLIYHVMTRGNGRMTIFHDDQDHRHYLSLFSEVMQEFEMFVWNYCLMSNHTHATLQPTARNLSNAMKRLNETYAQWWNKRHDHVGHVFQGRFKSQVVQADRHLLELCRYVPLNPVRAGLVSSPEDWPWSSYASIIGVRPSPVFLNPNCTLSLFGDDDPGELRSRYRDFVFGDPDHELQERFRSRSPIVGDRAFRLAVLGWGGRMGSSYDPALTPSFRTRRTDPAPTVAAPPDARTGTEPSEASSAPV